MQNPSIYSSKGTNISLLMTGAGGVERVGFGAQHFIPPNSHLSVVKSMTTHSGRPLTEGANEGEKKKDAW